MPPLRVLLYAVTLGGAPHGGAGRDRALPPPLSVALLASVVYVGLILTGVFALRLRMFVDAVTRGRDGARGWALTFDDGPDPVTTPRVLDALDAAGAKATFFVIARKAEAHPELLREITRRGHTIGLALVRARSALRPPLGAARAGGPGARDRRAHRDHR